MPDPITRTRGNAGDSNADLEDAAEPLSASDELLSLLINARGVSADSLTARAIANSKSHANGAPVRKAAGSLVLAYELPAVMAELFNFAACNDHRRNGLYDRQTYATPSMFAEELSSVPRGEGLTLSEWGNVPLGIVLSSSHKGNYYLDPSQFDSLYGRDIARQVMEHTRQRLERIYIGGLDPRQLLCALWEEAGKPPQPDSALLQLGSVESVPTIGIGIQKRLIAGKVLSAEPPPSEFKIEQVLAEYSEAPVDRLQGRRIGVAVKGTYLNPRPFDSMYGVGAALRAVEAVRS